MTSQITSNQEPISSSFRTKQRLLNLSRMSAVIMDGVKLIIIGKMLHQSMHMTRSQNHRQIRNNVKMTVIMIMQDICRTVVIPMLMLIFMGMTHKHPQT